MHIGAGVAMVDWKSGSQSLEKSHWHAMRNGLNGESGGQAAAKWASYIAEELAKCTWNGLYRALHAQQDRWSPSHEGFQPYTGLSGLTWRHFRFDWDGDAAEFAEPETRQTVVSWMEGCRKCEKGEPEPVHGDPE